MKKRIPSLDEYSKLNESKEHYLLQQILELSNDGLKNKNEALTKLQKIRDMIKFAFPSL